MSSGACLLYSSLVTLGSHEESVGLARLQAVVGIHVADRNADDRPRGAGAVRQRLQHDMTLYGSLWQYHAFVSR